MGIRDDDAIEQLVSQVLCVARVVELSEPQAITVRRVPEVLAAVQRDLAGSTDPAAFGASVKGIRIRYSLRDGWTMLGLRRVLNLGISARLLRLLPGGVVVLGERADESLANFEMSTRERLLLTRALGHAPANVTSA